MKIKSVCAIALLILVSITFHPGGAFSTGIELWPVTLRNMNKKAYIAKGVEGLLLARLLQKGFKPFMSRDMEIETGYVLKCSIAPKGAQGMVLAGDIWRKKDFITQQGVRPLKSFSLEVESEEGLFQAVNELSDMVARAIELDQASSKAKSLKKNRAPQGVAVLSLKNAKKALESPVEHRPGEKDGVPDKPIQGTGPEDSIPDQAPDLLSDDDLEEESTPGITLFFIPFSFSKIKTSHEQNKVQYTDELIVQTPEEIMSEEFKKKARQTSLPSEMLQKRQEPHPDRPSASDGGHTPSSPGDTTDGHAMPKDSERPLPTWKWF